MTKNSEHLYPIFHLFLIKVEVCKRLGCDFRHPVVHVELLGRDQERGEVEEGRHPAVKRALRVAHFQIRPKLTGTRIAGVGEPGKRKNGVLRISKEPPNHDIIRFRGLNISLDS